MSGMIMDDGQLQSMFCFALFFVVGAMMRGRVFVCINCVLRVCPRGRLVGSLPRIARFDFPGLLPQWAI